MKRKLLSTVLAVTMAVSRLTGCGQSGTNEATGAGAATTDAKTETYRVRIPIDSCDFSLAHYEADGEEADENFEHFSFERVEKYILPLLDAAEKAYVGKLDILLSPLKSAGLHEDQWRAEQRRQIKAGIHGNAGQSISAVTLRNTAAAGTCGILHIS